MKMIGSNVVFALVIIAAGVLLNLKKDKKGRKIIGRKSTLTACNIVLVGIFFLYCVPVLMGCIVFYPNFEILKSIPGTAEQWFAFWASYSGAAATVIIAFFTYINSKKIGEQEERFFQAFYW